MQSSSPAEKTPPDIANQAFPAQGGQQVRFMRQDAQWMARVTERLGVFSRLMLLPVVCERHGDIEAALLALQAKPTQYVQRRIQVLPQNAQHPALVFIGAQGLQGGMDRAGQPSGSGEPQDELPMGQGQELAALHPGSPPAQASTIDDDLIDAAERGHLQGVQRCLSEGANIEAKNNQGVTPLMIAARRGKLEMVQYLVDQGAHIEAKNRLGVTALYLAAYNGRLEVAQYLAKQGANIEVKENTVGNTVFAVATQLGKLEVVQYLKELGADIEAKNNQDATPLYIAACNGRLEVVEYLVGQNANIEARENSIGATPLCGASQNGHLEVVQYLADQGANIEAKSHVSSTPLWIAAQLGKLEVVKYLVGKGAHIETSDDAGATPLYVAAQNGHLGVVQFLVEHGALVDQAMNAGATPLFIAASQGHRDVVEYLIEQGANIEATENSYGRTPLYAAAHQGHLEVVEYLVGQSANIEARENSIGATPLWVAAHEGKLEVVEYLVGQSANIEATENSYGRTPLYAAAENGHLEVVKYLVGRGVNIEARNNEGATPLMIAEQNNHQEVVAYFRRQDANMLWAKMLDEDNYSLLRARLNNNQIRTDEIIEKGGVRRPLLHWACCEGKPNLVAELLYGRAEQHVGNMNDLPGIERAAVSSELVVDTETRDPSGLSPLHHAASAGHLAIVQMLVEYQEILVANSVVEPGHPLKYTEYVASLVDYVNRPTRGRQTALQLAKAHHNHEVSAYLKGISKGGFYCCQNCVSRSPLSKLAIYFPGGGFWVETDRGGNVMPRRRLFNEHRVWSEVREERAQPQPGTSS